MKLVLNKSSLVIKNKKLLTQTSMEVSFNKMQIKGLNGSGKTTMLNCIKEQTNGFQLESNNVSYINQKLILLLNLSINENINLLAPFENTIINQLLTIFPNLDLSKKVKKLSGGQKQILNFLIGFNQQAEVYLIDEPFNNVDKAKREIILDMLTNSDKHLIIVAHGYNLEFCDTKMTIKDKRINVDE